MTATPVNNSVRDLYHQLMLFARHTARFKDIGIPDLTEYFKAAEESAAGRGDSASAMFKLIDATSVRRTRRFIQTHYPNARLDGKPISFPEAKLKTKLYPLDDALPGLFAGVRDDVDKLTLARYQPDNYRLDGQADARAQALAGILRTGLLKRFESSVHAFRLTLETMIGACEEFLAELDEGRVLVAGARRSSGGEADDPAELAEGIGEGIAPIADYKAGDLRADVEEDLEMLRGLHAAVADATDRRRPEARRPCGTPRRRARAREGDRLLLLRRHGRLDRECARSRRRARARALRRAPLRSRDRDRGRDRGSGSRESISSRQRQPARRQAPSGWRPRTRRTSSSRLTSSPKDKTSSRPATSSTTTCPGTRCGSCSETAASTGLGAHSPARRSTSTTCSRRASSTRS